jgi:hypothetical protein
VAGVSVIPLIVKAKERREVPGGGANGTAERVKLTVASPVLQLTVQTITVFGPLQAAREKTASKRTGRNERDLLRFMWHPTTE